MNKILFYVGRALFAGLFIFEALNWLGILHFTLDFTWLGLLLTSGFVWFACEYAVAKFSSKELPYGSRAAIFIVAAVPTYLDAVGDMRLWYTYIPHYDKYLHFAGGAAATCLAGIALYTYAQRKHPTFIVSRKWLAWITFLIGIALGVLYEFEEYLEDVFTGSHRSGGGPDTAGDLLFDTMGAALVVIVLVLVWRSRAKSRKSK